MSAPTWPQLTDPDVAALVDEVAGALAAALWADHVSPADAFRHAPPDPFDDCGMGSLAPEHAGPMPRRSALLAPWEEPYRLQDVAGQRVEEFLRAF